MADDTGTEFWRSLLSTYETIVLVANSEEALAVDLGARWPSGTLFVFFNDARRVVAERFDRDALLVLRSGREGPSVIRRNRLGPVAACFAPGRLKGILNLVVAETEAPASLSEHEGCPVVPLDLTGYFADRYTGGKIASSGYAMAVWISAMLPDARVVLCGFNALRSENWKVFDIHDWAFEQTALRLATRLGAVEIEGTPRAGPDAVSALQAQFPGADLSALLAVHAEVLAERLEHTNRFVDKLWSLTRFSRLGRKLLTFWR